jgi:hypothetical protein
MAKLDDRLVSFARVDRARSVLADATSLEALTPYCDEVIQRTAFGKMPLGPSLANTVQALIVHEFVYGDFLLFDQQAGFETSEELFPDVMRRLFIHPELRREIAKDMQQLGHEVHFLSTSRLKDKQLKIELDIEESSEKPLLDTLCRCPAVTGIPRDLLDDRTLDIWTKRKVPLTAFFPLEVLTSSQTPARAFWYLRLAQEAGLPLAASPSRSFYFTKTLPYVKEILLSSEADRLLTIFDKSIVTSARLKEWREQGIRIEEIRIPPVAEYVVRIAQQKQMSLASAIHEVRRSRHAREFRKMCAELQGLLLDGSAASMLARDRAINQLKDVAAHWSSNCGPITKNKTRAFNVCLLAEGLADLLPYFGIIGAEPLITALNHSLKAVGLDKLRLNLPWRRRGLKGELFLSDLYLAPSPL